MTYYSYYKVNIMSYARSLLMLYSIGLYIYEELTLLEMRRKVKLPACEGILIVKERKKENQS